MRSPVCRWLASLRKWARTWSRPVFNANTLTHPTKKSPTTLVDGGSIDRALPMAMRWASHGERARTKCAHDRRTPPASRPSICARRRARSVRSRRATTDARRRSRSSGERRSRRKKNGGVRWRCPTGIVGEVRLLLRHSDRTEVVGVDHHLLDHLDLDAETVRLEEIRQLPTVNEVDRRRVNSCCFQRGGRGVCRRDTITPRSPRPDIAPRKSLTVEAPTVLECRLAWK